MDKNDIQDLNRRLLIAEGEFRNKRSQNEVAKKYIASNIESLPLEDIEALSRVGIDINFLVKVDLKSLETNKEYRERFKAQMQSLKSQINSFVDRGLSAGEGKF